MEKPNGMLAFQGAFYIFLFFLRSQIMSEIHKEIAIIKHAKDRLEERGMKTDDITHAITSGEIIKQYEDEKP